MKKAQRLIQLMMIVNERKRFTIREIQDELGVSRRTVIRDLMELGELGVPLYSEVGAAGGYRVLKGKMLPPISFTEHEAAALFFASQSLKRYVSLPFKEEAQSALQKFYHYLPGEIKARMDRLQDRLLFWVPPRNREAPHLRGLLEASLDQRVAIIRYGDEDAAEERSIQPIGIYAMNGLWYCPAYCFKAEAFRMFRADRVHAIRLDPDQSKRKNLDGETIERWTMRTEEADGLELRVRLTKEGAKRAQTDPWLAEGLTIQADGTGHVRMSMPRSYLEWAAGFILGFGTEAIVEEPFELRQEIKKLLDRLTPEYADGGE